MNVKTLCIQIQNLPPHYYSTILDIFIQHQCVINETKRGSNKGVSIAMDFVPANVLEILQKRVDVIMKLEEQNIQIKDARDKLNKQNPEQEGGLVPNGLSANGSTPGPNAPSPAIPGNNGSALSLPNKISTLKMSLYQNDSALHRASSACLWCTLPIQPFRQICIPTQIQLTDGELNVSGYGSFCRPECAAGHLMNESIDISTKYERYMLLNQLYIKHANGMGITPAVSPHYIMDKFMGTLTPDEYLTMTGGVVQYNIIKKPFTHIMPELHEKYVIAKGRVA